MQSNVSRALDVLTLNEVWELTDVFGQGVPAPVRDGVIKSPFRPDRTPSFSVSKGLRRWKDFASNYDAAGVKAFVEACRPEWDAERVNEYLVKRAGLEWLSKEDFLATKHTKEARSSQKDAGADEAKEAQVRKTAAALQARRAKKQAKVERAHAQAHQRETALEFPPSPMLPPLRWPDCVRDAWETGLQQLTEARQARLAASRNWPGMWTGALWLQEKVAYVRLPWTSDTSRVKHGIGFRVEAPQFIDGTFKRLVPTGYHVRWAKPMQEPAASPSAGSGQVRKAWAFVPSVPKPGKRFYGDLEKLLKREASQMGLEPGEQWCEPVPFVLGSPDPARLCVVTEGQWDAITLWGALGGFDDSGHTPHPMLSETLVLGVRGAQGTEALLRHWGEWLKRTRPAVWILADNDAAGDTWTTAKRQGDGSLRPAFTERLKANGLDTVKVTRVRKDYGKDFNDLYKARRPSVDAMWAWVERLGLVKEVGDV